jgi:acyl-coenzyme A thioesterase PaaI-like protein
VTTSEHLLQGEPPIGAFAAEDGWRYLPVAAFSGVIGAVHVRGEPGARTVALDCGPQIGNDRIGNVHGGALMTFADMALGIRVADSAGHRQMATVQLSYSFAAGVKVGSRLSCAAELVRRTSQLVFVRGVFEADGKVVGSAEGIFRLFEA